MQKYILVCFLVVSQLSFTSAYAQEGVALYKKEWKSCVENDECVVMKGLCSKWVSVNNLNIDKIEDMKRKYATLMFCGVLPDSDGIKPNSICENNECKIVNEGEWQKDELY